MSDLIPLAVLGAIVTSALGLLLFALDRLLRASDAEHVRRAVLAQLAIAAERNLPLAPALRALADDLERVHARTSLGCGVFLIVLAPLLLFPPFLVFAMGWWILRVHRARRRDVVAAIAGRLEEGDLRRALEPARDAFPAPLPEVLGAAEKKGALVAALGALRGLGDAAERLRGDVRSSLVYPAAVLLGAEIVALFFTVVLKDRLYWLVDESFGAEADVTVAMALLRAQPFVEVGLPLLLAALAVAGGGIAPGASRIARFLARLLPWTSRAELCARASLVARTAAALLRAGLPLDQALAAAAPAAGRSREAIARAAARAAEGATLALALAPERDPVALRLAIAADASPEVGLAAAADAARDEQAAAVHGAARAVLPIAILSLGAFVACHYWPPFLILAARERTLW